MQKIVRLVVGAGLGCWLGCSAALAGGTVTGVWIDHTGRGAVEIVECGPSLCGRIVWLKDADHDKVCGMQVIGNVRPAGGGRWDGGWIYDPDEERKASVELTPMGDRLKVLGYLGAKFLGESMTWTRAPGSLPRCAA